MRLLPADRIEQEDARRSLARPRVRARDARDRALFADNADALRFNTLKAWQIEELRRTLAELIETRGEKCHREECEVFRAHHGRLSQFFGGQTLVAPDLRRQSARAIEECVGALRAPGGLVDPCTKPDAPHVDRGPKSLF